MVVEIDVITIGRFSVGLKTDIATAEKHILPATTMVWAVALGSGAHGAGALVG